MSFMIIKTDGKTGAILSVDTVHGARTVIETFDAACKDWQHVTVTLWDATTNASLGSREIGKPIPTAYEIEYWIRNDSAVRTLMFDYKKIQAIKSTREKFPHLGLRETKDYVENVMRELEII